MTLDITLTRAGTGYEYPQFIDFQHAMEHEMTWGQDFFDDESEYRTFADDHRSRRSVHSRFGAYTSKMLMVKPMDVLEVERGKRERDRDVGPISTSASYPSGKRPVRSGTVRIDFAEMGLGKSDVYKFTAQLPM